MTTKTRVLLYGATGYMGRMLARAAKAENLPVVLAARNKPKLAELANELGLPYRTIVLETPQEREERIQEERRAPLGSVAAKQLRTKRQKKSHNATLDQALQDVQVVLNAAGPFGDTAMPLARACVRNKTHYTDIGGEYDVLNELNDLNQLAIDRKTVLMPGVGLTLAASDFLIRLGVRRAKPKGMGPPHVVRISLSRVPFISRGSARTMLASVRDGVRVIRNTKDERVPVGTLVRSFNFDLDSDESYRDTRICTAMTLADLLTAGQTAQRSYSDQAWNKKDIVTQNLETYVEASNIERFGYEFGAEFALALRSRPLKGIFDRAISMWPEGPEPDDRAQTRQLVSVEVEDRYRRGFEYHLATPNSYDFTVTTAVEVTRGLLKGTTEPHFGFLSPAWAPGVDDWIKDELNGDPLLVRSTPLLKLFGSTRFVGQGLR